MLQCVLCLLDAHTQEGTGISGGRKREAQTSAMADMEDGARGSPPSKRAKRELSKGVGAGMQQVEREAEGTREERGGLQLEADAPQKLANKAMGPASGLAFEIRELACLKSQGLLTDSEFTSAKAALFNIWVK